jgi:hypothetical protein
MNDITQDTLQRLTVPTAPTASLKPHQVQLKQALLAASRPQRASKLPSSLNQVIQEWRDFMSRNMSKKKFIISGATLGFTALAIVAISLFGTQSPDAYAEQLAAQGVQKVSKLSPEQQQALNQQLDGGNALADLKTAQQAKDLTVLTYDQVVKQEPQIGISDVRIPNTTGSGSTWINLQSLKYLRYTDAQGATHILGVDAQGVPALELIFQTSSAKTTASAQGAGNVSVASPNGSNSQPATSSTSSTATHASALPVVKPTPAPAPAPIPAPSPPPVQTQTPLSVLTGIIAGLNNGQEAEITAVNVALAGPVSTGQGQPLVFTASGQTYFAYTQEQAPNFNTTAAQTASTMAIVPEPAADSGVALTQAHIDKGNLLVDENEEGVGYCTGGN